MRDYYAAINRAQYEGDIAGLEALSIPECNCRAVAMTLKELRGLGTIEGARWQLDEVSVHHVSPKSASAVVSIRADDGRVIAADGAIAALIENQGGGDFLHAMLNIDGRWLTGQVREQ